MISSRLPMIRIVSPPTLYECEAHWSWNPAPLPDYDLWCVLRGGAELTINDVAEPVSAGDCILLRPGTIVRGHRKPRTPLDVFACHFVPERQDHVWAEWMVSLPREPFVCDRTLLDALAQHSVRSFRSGDAEGVNSAALGLLQIMAAGRAQATNRNGDSRDERILRCMDAIDRQPGADWSVERLARMATLSRTHFTRMFGRTASHSPARHVIAARVRRAQVLLAETDMTIAQIAEALGYRDEFYFRRQFQRETGLPPARFRRERRGKRI